MNQLLDTLAERVLLCDGAVGSRVQALDLDLERDFEGRENCTEILARTRPDIVRDIHRSYLAAGSDVIQTNTFGGSPITLAEFDLGDAATELNQRAAELAREAIAEFSDGRQRFVLGAIGPGTKLPSLGHIGYDELEGALRVQAAALIAGGADGIIVETCQDPLQIKAAVNASKQALATAGKDLAILVQVTVETTGTLLVGSDIAAAATAIRALDVPMIGLNCATGPQEMAEHVRWLGQNWPGPISVQPNAGLPELVDGKTHYPLTPQEAAAWLERFVVEDGIAMIGGCCGTTGDHIAAMDDMLRRVGSDRDRPRPVERQVHWVPAVASLYGQVPYRQENAFFSIGERCNANGSRKFREHQAAEEWDACVAMARTQVDEGSHAIDLCTAFVGRDEHADIQSLTTRMRGAVNAPLVIDSTELDVIEAALKLYGGKAIINSINFEDGEEPAAARLALARKYGAGVIALTIDESGMAKTADEKLEIARRLYRFACETHGLPAADLLFDPLTFTICTGNEDDRRLGLETLVAVERIASELPDCQVILGLSNISFGLKPAARHVLNSVFLDQAVRRGLSGAIVHLSKIRPLHSIPAEEVAIAEDLVFDRREGGKDPLQDFIALFEDRQAEESTADTAPKTVEERLVQRIVDGNRLDLERDLDEALEAHDALTIINQYLLDGMKVVGELFGSGKMQLPFVLQSAETMKKAVAHLEPHMERSEGTEKGIIVLATVKGDVHDIGKNLVDIILTNNGYKVVNLGIKQPIAEILAAADAHGAHAIGLSGLLVKSTVIMRENLEEMNRQGFDVPVILGGAALTRKYVEQDCVAAHQAGRVAYARDAFEGLGLMEKVMGDGFDAHVQAATARWAERPKPAPKPARGAQLDRPVDYEDVALRRAELAREVTVPEPPFWGARVMERVAVEALLPFLNETMLFQFQWGFRKAGKSREEYRAWADREVRPHLARMLKLCAEEGILQPQAVYGYWPAAADRDDLVLFDPDSGDEVARFALPRQKRLDGLCMADFFRDMRSGERDVVALQAVTIGQHASDVARQWFAADRYQDYLYLHGLGVELAEALAEYVHKRVRGELGFSHLDDRDPRKMIKQGYRGARYSFGYPACPNLTDQRQLLDLLGAERVGLVMGEADQLHPEQSTSAIVVHHPQARYFSV